MVLEGLWALAPLLDPVRLDPAAPAGLLVALAVVAASLLIAAVLGVPAPVPAGLGARAFARRLRVAAPPRLTDPDAAGRPRSRAPTALPAAG